MVRARIHAGLGELALRRDDLREARLHLEKSIEAVDSIRASHTLLAEACFRSGDHESARRQQAIAEGLPSQFEWPDPYYDKVRALQNGLNSRLEYAFSLAVRKAA